MSCIVVLLQVLLAFFDDRRIRRQLAEVASLHERYDRKSEARLNELREMMADECDDCDYERPS